MGVCGGASERKPGGRRCAGANFLAVYMNTFLMPAVLQDSEIRVVYVSFYNLGAAALEKADFISSIRIVL